MIWTVGLLICFLCCGEAAAEGARQALDACAAMVIPSLFPFFVLSGTLIGCGAAQAMAKHLAKPMQRWFGIAPDGAIAIGMGLLGGYPLGAQAAVSLYEAKRIGKRDCERLLCFCNNTGPAFFLGAVGLGIFSDLRLGLLLYGIHAVSALLVGRLWHAQGGAYSVRPLPQPAAPFAVVFSQAVVTAVKNTLRICGFVVFFGAFLAVLQQLVPSRAVVLCAGVLEMTSGVMALRALPKAAAFCLAEMILSWGGLCVHCQTLSLCAGLSMRRYLLSKALHSLISGLLALPIAAFCFLRPAQQAVSLGCSGGVLIFIWIFSKNLQKRGSNSCRNWV